MLVPALCALCPNDSRLDRHPDALLGDRGWLLLRGWWRRLGLRLWWLWACLSFSLWRYRSGFLPGEFFAGLPRLGAERRLPLCPAEGRDSSRVLPSSESGSLAIRTWRRRRGGVWQRGTLASGLAGVARRYRRIGWRICLCRWLRSTCVLR